MCLLRDDMASIVVLLQIFWIGKMDMCLHSESEEELSP